MNDLPETITESSDTKKPKKNLSILVIAVIALLIVGASYWFFNSSKEDAVTIQQQPAPVPEVVEPVQTSTDITMSGSENVTNTVSNEQEKVLIEETILSEPIAEDVSLQQEEIDKLKEIETQLTEQKNNLEAQSQDVDELIRLKEEQIRLLEAELAKKQ